MRLGTIHIQGCMCCTGWVKCEGMCSEESLICDEIFESSVIVHLVRKNIVVESGIRYGVLNSFEVLCVFC